MHSNNNKRVLLACSNDEISRGIALHLANSGCRRIRGKRLVWSLPLDIFRSPQIAPTRPLFPLSSDHISPTPLLLMFKFYNSLQLLPNSGYTGWVVLLGNEGYVQEIVKYVTSAVKGFDSFKIVYLLVEQITGAAFDAAINSAWKAFGGLDAFVNCWAYEGKVQPLLEMNEKEFQKTVQVNFMATCYLLKSVARRMRDSQSGGSIVLLSQILGSERGLYPGSAVYGSSLAAVQQLARLSALELGKYNIRVNAIARGLHLDDPYPLSVGKAKAETSTDTVMPLKRWLDPKNDLASTVIYLVGDDSRYMTGTTIFVDGAQSLVRPRMRSFI